MLLVVYLEYLDIVFVVERLLHIHSNHDDSALLTAATSVLSTTVSSSRHLSRNSGAYVDYVWVVRKASNPDNNLAPLILFS